MTVCKNGIPVNPNEGGAVGNIDAVNTDPNVVFAFAHKDLFDYYQLTDPNFDNVIIQKLGNEQVHIIVSKVPKFTHWTRDVVFNSIIDLKDYSVGGAGGGVFTAKLLNKHGNYGFKSVEEYPNGDLLLSAVVNGDIAAAVIVGKNLPILKDKKWADKLTIITMGAEVPDDLKKYYSKGSVNYPGFTTSVTPTFETPVIIVSRAWSGDAKKSAVQSLKECIATNKGTLSDLGGFWKGILPAKNLEPDQ